MEMMSDEDEGDLVCSDCGVRLGGKGDHAVVWGPSSEPVTVRFICLPCSEAGGYSKADLPE
jgi:hypothetical protein